MAQCSAQAVVVLYFEVKLLEEHLKILFVRTRCAFQNGRRNTTIPGREAALAPCAGGLLILAVTSQMHLKVATT